jgi:hypothetical protein
LAVKERFMLDLRVGQRTLEMARQLVGSVGLVDDTKHLPLLLIDDHLTYPQAILDVFGQIQHRRRRTGRGRKKHPTLKPPLGLQVGVVKKQRDQRGNLLKVKTKALFGTKHEIEKRIRKLGIGEKINTSHIERFNGTLRSQQARLMRRTRYGSHRSDLLQQSLWLYRDIYNWTRPHESLWGESPAMALGLSDTVWPMRHYVRHPVHVSDLQREYWKECRNNILKSAVEHYCEQKTLPIS